MKVFCALTVCILIGSQEALSSTRDDGDTAGSAVVKLLQKVAGHNNGELTIRLDILAKTVENINMAIEMSPLMKDIFKEVATKNAEVAIALKVISGKVPDVADFLHLLTSRHQTMANSLAEALSKSPEVKQFNKLRTDPDFRTSLKKLAAVVKLLTGRKVRFQQDLVNAIASGTYTTTIDNAAEAGLLNVVYFVVDNWDNVISATKFHGSTKDAVDVLQNLAKLDFSDLMKVKVIQSGLNDKKYKVDGGESLVSDPDVISLQGDLEGAQALGHSQHDQDVAAQHVSAVFHDLCSLCVHTTERFAKQQANVKQGIVG